MKIVNIVLLSVWLMLFGAVTATWITMSAHSLGIVTFIVGVAILIIQFVVPIA